MAIINFAAKFCLKTKWCMHWRVFGLSSNSRSMTSSSFILFYFYLIFKPSSNGSYHCLAKAWVNLASNKKNKITLRVWLCIRVVFDTSCQMIDGQLILTVSHKFLFGSIGLVLANHKKYYLFIYLLLLIRCIF